MKNVFKSEKGINLISLTVSVIVILTLTGIILYNVKDNLCIQNLKSMQNDIGNLRDKVSSYYAQYGTIPTHTKYTNIQNVDVISEAVDTGDFYVIDLSAMENITLTYGKDYQKIQNKEATTIEQINTLEDLYIINETSHNIFYVKGIALDGETFYTDYTKENVDNDAVNFKYPDGINVTEELWSPRYNETAVYKDKNEDTVNIPLGFQVSRKTGEDKIREGLVIKNEETNDRYVWIQVPKTIFKTASSEIDYEKIENDLKTYTGDYAKEGYKDIYYDGCGIETQDEYNKLKNKMLSSIYKNEGFWISQYEIGTSEVRNSTIVGETSQSSKEGEYPYNYVTIEQAQKLATTKSNSGNYTSSLLFGLQWDLVLKFIETTEAKTEIEIKADSTSWGNYKNSEFDITRGKYGTTSWQDVNSKLSKTKTNQIMLSTGATTRNSVLNIYDLAGNMEEWTLEKNTSSENPSVTRGGSYINDVVNNLNESYVSSRSDRAVSGSDSFIGFRITLY